MTVVQRTRQMAPIRICICIQSLFIEIHSVVANTFWYCAKLIHMMAHQPEPIIAKNAPKLQPNVLPKNHGLALNKNTLCWILMVNHWDGQRTVSQDHKDRIIAALVLIKSMDVMWLKLTIAPVCMPVLRFAAPMPKWCPLNGNSKLDHALVFQSVMTCGSPVSCCTEFQKNLA